MTNIKKIHFRFCFHSVWMDLKVNGVLMVGPTLMEFCRPVPVFVHIPHSPGIDLHHPHLIPFIPRTSSIRSSGLFHNIPETLSIDCPFCSPHQPYVYMFKSQNIMIPDVRWLRNLLPPFCMFLILLPQLLLCHPLPRSLGFPPPTTTCSRPAPLGSDTHYKIHNAPVKWVISASTRTTIPTELFSVLSQFSWAIIFM